MAAQREDLSMERLIGREEGSEVVGAVRSPLLVCKHPGMAETRVALTAAARVGEGPVWAGRALDVLYVTSAREGLNLAPGGGALDGSLFAVTATGATGLASAPFAGSA